MREEEENVALEPIDAVTDACVECGTPAACRADGCACEVRCNLSSHNWLADVPDDGYSGDVVEVHFKNTRRGFYRNTSHLALEQGDWVAVEASPGHDIGRVALTGRLVEQQMRRVGLKSDTELLRVFRKARAGDLEKYEQAKAREADTMIRSRQIAADLGLQMKIGDVEYQGDGNKAIFYYIADERVDFRQLIKVLADVFKIRVEMKQIGARQEAGRIGGIGPCGRPLCCATWMTRFVSVSTAAARYQDVSLNPQKLAGQCAKLKCCINFEVDAYIEASKQMPPHDVPLETEDAIYYHFKTDLFKREMTYSTERRQPANLVTVPVERVEEVMAMNQNGIKPEHLAADDAERAYEQKAFGDILGQDSISRFDKKKKKKKKSKEGRGPKDETGGSEAPARREERPEGQPSEGQQPRQQRRRPDKPVKAAEGGDASATPQPERPQGQEQGQGRRNQRRRGHRTESKE
ncbi:MAG: hypothetical protein IJU62_08860 [Muribaculaceae bacterium]|nr:hypothetical protein [Muribaculaceae bacterium]